MPYRLGQRTIPFKNSSGETAPAFGVMRVTNWTDIPITVGKPTGNEDPSELVINTHHQVSNNKYGECTVDLPTRVKFSGGPPNNGERWKHTNNWHIIEDANDCGAFPILGGDDGESVFVSPFSCMPPSSSSPSSGSSSSAIFSTIDDCTSCLDNVAPMRWSFTLSGITNCAVGCHPNAQCSFHVGGTLVYQPTTNCTWRVLFPNSIINCANVLATRGYQLTLVGATFTLTGFPHFPPYLYTVPGGTPFDCLQPIVVTRSVLPGGFCPPSGGNCDGFPQTLILTPA